MLRKLEYFEQELSASPTGREVLDVVRGHVEEVSQLVNTNRTVMVAWHRNNGPRFLASVMESGFDENSRVQKEIDGVTLQRLLLRMADALQQTGSRGLVAAVSRFAAPVINAADECNSVAGVFRQIRSGSLGARPL